MHAVRGAPGCFYGPAYDCRRLPSPDEFDYLGIDVQFICSACRGFRIVDMRGFDNGDIYQRNKFC